MKHIELTQGKVALVDDRDYDRLNQWKWYAHKNKNTYYATRSGRLNGKTQTSIKMHREIMNPSANMKEDHSNGNGLDNTRTNLRVCTNQQNCANRKVSRNNKLGLKGVAFCNTYKKWTANIKVNYKNKFLGNFFCPWKAAGFYDIAAIKYYGEYAKPNGVKCNCIPMLCAAEGE